jgi:hypothetical protein
MSIVSSCHSAVCGKQRTPSYRKHKPTGQAVVTVNGRDHYLGKWNTKASLVAYDRLIAEWLDNGRQLPSEAEVVTVASGIKAYWSHAKQHYRRADGSETNEIGQMRYSLRPLNHLYGTTPAREIGPLKFKAVRGMMIRGYEHPKYGTQPPLSRGVVNHRMGRIKRMFRWAVENELIPPSVYHGLLSVCGLQSVAPKLTKPQASSQWPVPSSRTRCRSCIPRWPTW